MKKSFLLLFIIIAMLFTGCAGKTADIDKAEKAEETTVQLKKETKKPKKKITKNSADKKNEDTTAETTAEPEVTAKSEPEEEPVVTEPVYEAPETEEYVPEYYYETETPEVTPQVIQPETSAPVVTSAPETPRQGQTPETTKPAETQPEKGFDISYWVEFAKSYAVSIGLELVPDATGCWDNPINANSRCIYLERDITGRLNRYKNHDGFEGVWVWSEDLGNGEYLLYIGYC